MSAKTDYGFVLFAKIINLFYSKKYNPRRSKKSPAALRAVPECSRIHDLL